MKSVSIIVLTLLLTHHAWSQRAVTDSLLNAAEQAYDNAAYESAELIARRLLELRSAENTDKIACERIIAFSLIAQGKPALAREHFIAILRMNPAFELDPVLTSPKILSVFAETKRQYTPPKAADSTMSIAQVPVVKSISFRAIVFPGWEQYYQGRTGTGSVLLALGAVSLGAGITSEFLRSSARKEYLAATLPGDIADKYKIYNRYHHAEVYSFAAFALTYIASQIDLFAGSQVLEAHAGLAPDRSTTLTLTLRF